MEMKYDAISKNFTLQYHTTNVCTSNTTEVCMIVWVQYNIHHPASICSSKSSAGVVTCMCVCTHIKYVYIVEITNTVHTHTHIHTYRFTLMRSFTTAVVTLSPSLPAMKELNGTRQLLTTSL